jgi:agmatinase
MSRLRQEPPPEEGGRSRRPAYSALLLAHAAQILPRGAGRFWIENQLSGRGIEIEAQELEFLRVFREPTTTGRALQGSSLDPARVEALVQALQGLGILTPVGLHNRLPPHLTIQTQQTLFRVPRLDPETQIEACDLCFFGVPYEGGRTGLAGAAWGPDRLRAYSQSLAHTVSVEDGRSAGWYDYDEGRHLLRHSTLYDAGNVVVVPGEASSEMFHRIDQLVRCILRSQGVPVGLGGDHSITAPILRGFGGRELTVVQFDAHADLEDLAPPEILHHGNVMRRALELPGIRCVAALGVRGYGVAPEADARNPWLSARTLRRRGAQAMIDILPKDTPVYVTVDLDVLDPAYAPEVGTPQPGGLAPDELKALLWELGTTLEVAGFDVVELSPRDTNEVSLAIAADLILTLAGAVYQRMYSGPVP